MCQQLIAIQTVGYALDRPKAGLAKDFTEGELNVHILIQTATELAWHVENLRYTVNSLSASECTNHKCT